MKAIKILTHPVLLIGSFLFVLISGEHFGGFYILYLLLALPHGGVHAMLALAGVLLILFSYIKFKRSKKYLIEPVLNIIGAACLSLSLFFFFYNDRQGYNAGTFDQLVPQVTFVLFGLLTIGFVIDNLTGSAGKKPANDKLSIL